MACCWQPCHRWHLLARMVALFGGCCHALTVPPPCPWRRGPLGWLIPSEILPLECRSAGVSLFTAVNFLVAFLTTQTTLSVMCAIEWGTFVLYACVIVIMVVFAVFCMPETRAVPLEQMAALWRSHWLWRRLAGSSSGAAAVVGAAEKQVAAGQGGVKTQDLTAASCVDVPLASCDLDKGETL